MDAGEGIAPHELSKLVGECIGRNAFQDAEWRDIVLKAVVGTLNSNVASSR